MIKTAAMRKADFARLQTLSTSLQAYEAIHGTPVGIQVAQNRDVFVRQVVDSIRRIEFISALFRRPINAKRADPSSDIFDPLRAAIWHESNGDFDEACWMVFLATHFGKHSEDGWRLVRDVYGALGGKAPWTWKRVSADPKAFRKWLQEHKAALKQGNVTRRFSNHRKYESLNGLSNNGTGAAVESYVDWVGPTKSHHTLFLNAQQQAGTVPADVFDWLFNSMNVIARYGRLARFDHLTMLGKLKLAPISPGSAYLKDATGPLRGARLFFGGSTNAAIKATNLEAKLRELDHSLSVGMQVLEDSLCNWQKSPDHFVSFRG
jgi:hypothetical protein